MYNLMGVKIMIGYITPSTPPHAYALFSLWGYPHNAEIPPQCSFIHIFTPTMYLLHVHTYTQPHTQPHTHTYGAHFIVPCSNSTRSAGTITAHLAKIVKTLIEMSSCFDH